VEVALHDADHVHVLNAGATAVVDVSGQVEEEKENEDEEAVEAGAKQRNLFVE
jgi:hypothetical protein